MKTSHVLFALTAAAALVTLAAHPADAQSRPPSAASWIPGLPVPVFFPAGFPAGGAGVPLPIPGTGTPLPGTTAVPGTTAPPGGGVALPPTPGSFDTGGFLTPGWEAQEAADILRQLVAALPADKKSKVDGIPLAVDNTSGEVNAFAGCDNGASYMAITAPLMKAMAHIAEAKAADEIFGSKRVDAYTRQAADAIGAGQPVPSPPAGFYGPTEGLDPRKLARQRDIFDEEVAFVLGHELGHHYLGHTGCANGAKRGGVDPATIGRIATNIVPGFNQPNEISADVGGTNNLLDAGKARAAVGAQWNEGGALLVLNFFGTMQALKPSVIATGFLRSHPPPQLRTPIVQDTANRWRSAGGKSPAGGFPIPLPFPLPGL